MSLSGQMGWVEWVGNDPMTRQGLEPCSKPVLTGRCHEQTKRVAPLLILS
jgi:hypothetical protein